MRDRHPTEPAWGCLLAAKRPASSAAASRHSGAVVVSVGEAGPQPGDACASTFTTGPLRPRGHRGDDHRSHARARPDDSGPATRSARATPAIGKERNPAVQISRPPRTRHAIPSADRRLIDGDATHRGARSLRITCDVRAVAGAVRAASCRLYQRLDGGGRWGLRRVGRQPHRTPGAGRATWRHERAGARAARRLRIRHAWTAVVSARGGLCRGPARGRPRSGVR